MAATRKIKGLDINTILKTIQKRLAEVFILTAISTAPASAACRHALVLALDISGSVDPAEYRLQLSGVANALLASEVQELILSEPEAPITLSIFEWSSDLHQKMILDWTELNSRKTLIDIASVLANHSKDRATLKTAIGSALKFSKSLLDQKKNCWRRTIDLSGDGSSNDGQTPRETYMALDFEDITVNGLVVSLDKDTQNPIFNKQKELQGYFDSEVIHGFGSFSMLALGYEDYKRAISEKLLKELSAPIIGYNLHTLPKIHKKPL